MPYEALDISEGGEAYLPFAQTLLRNLKVVLNASGVNFGRRNYSTPDGNGSIIVRTTRIGRGDEQESDAWMDYIKIETCKNRQGFLLIHDNAFSEAPYVASYVDGVNERIHPVGADGTLEPQATSRTKGYVVPKELKTQTAVMRNAPSRYSGLMRQVVGCYHSGGKDAPFSYTWSRTHGVIKFTDTTAEPVDRYWIVEVSAVGVYAAPVRYTGECCGSWGVAHYMPTSAQITASPALVQHRNTLSLAWAFVGRPDSGIVQLISAEEMSAVYAWGTWYNGCGWAFSYSGHQAANVAVETITDGLDFSAIEDYYNTRLVMLDFSADFSQHETLILRATMTVGDPGRLTFERGSNGTLWVPSEWATFRWDGVFPFANPIDGDGPVHVFYDGDEQILTRWSSLLTEHAQQGGQPGWNGNATGADIPETGPFSIPICQSASCEQIYFEHSVGSGVNIAPYEQTDYGFYGPFDLRVSSITGHQVQSSSTASVSDEFLNESKSGNVLSGFYDICPDCWYEDPPGTLHTIGASQLIEHKEWDMHFERTDLSATEEESGTSTVMLFPLEREAVAGIKQRFFLSTAESSFHQRSTFGVRHEQKKISAGPDPWTDTDVPIVAWRGGYGGSDPTTPDTSGGSSQILTNEFHLRASGGITIDKTTLGNDLSPFMLWTLGAKETADSRLFMMRGNLYDADPDLVPPDQKENSVFYADNETIIGGGFEPVITDVISQVISFVGKA